MEYMWAPWRMEYIKQAAGHKEAGCILCDHPARKDDEKNLILYHVKYNYVIMNRYPYNAGHLMVAPERHCGTLDGLTDLELGREVLLQVELYHDKEVLATRKVPAKIGVAKL